MNFKRNFLRIIDDFTYKLAYYTSSKCLGILPSPISLFIHIIILKIKKTIALTHFVNESRNVETIYIYSLFLELIFKPPGLSGFIFVHPLSIRLELV